MLRTTLILVFCALTAAVFGQKVKQVKGNDFGDGITSKTYIGYTDMLDQLKASDTVSVTVRATVDEVCQVKGCWMTLKDGNPDAPDMMVKFKDYAFFVPFDIGGSDVIIEGQAYATEVPVDELRHYAEDAGKSKEEIAMITEPQRTYAFLASGVRVVEN